MSDIIGDELVEIVRDLDPLTDAAGRGFGHYVGEAGDRIGGEEGEEKPKPTPKLPDIAAATDPIAVPTEMPTQNSAAARAAKRRSLAIQAARRGRLSTILTNDDALGG